MSKLNVYAFIADYLWSYLLYVNLPWILFSHFQWFIIIELNRGVFKWTFPRCQFTKSDLCSMNHSPPFIIGTLMSVNIVTVKENRKTSTSSRRLYTFWPNYECAYIVFLLTNLVKFNLLENNNFLECQFVRFVHTYIHSSCHNRPISWYSIWMDECRFNSKLLKLNEFQCVKEEKKKTYDLVQSLTRYWKAAASYWIVGVNSFCVRAYWLFTPSTWWK